MHEIDTIDTRIGVTYPSGYRAAGVKAGIKASGREDVCLLVSDLPAAVAGAFTANRFAASSVRYDRGIVEAGQPVRAIVINSGNANAATGKNGEADTRATAGFAAEKLGVPVEQVLVSSTGRIGIPLPMDRIRKGVLDAVGKLSPDGGADALKAIMTTDTRPKWEHRELTAGGNAVRIGGMAKGAGMIAPSLRPAAPPHATMLAYLTTDAAVEPAFLRLCMDACLDESFNRITVDGDCSTNDTFLALANGAAGNEPLSADHPDAEKFAAAFGEVAASLARQMVLDGEGATRFVEVVVSGARTVSDARACAETIANSLLCKTAWFGGDPNWGRVIDAAGYSGADLNPEAVSLHYGTTPIVRNGIDAGTPEAEQAAAVKTDNVVVRLDLGVGDQRFTKWTCDLSYEYVRINAEYTT